MGLPIWGKIGIGWAISAAVGLYSLSLSRKSVEAHRYEAMKSRQRMRNAGPLE